MNSHTGQSNEQTSRSCEIEQNIVMNGTIVEENVADDVMHNNDQSKDGNCESANRYCEFVVAHSRLAFGVTLGLHVLMLVVTAVLLIAGYDILPIDFSGLPLNLQKDPAKLRTDAWWHVEASLTTTKNTSLPKRSIQYQTITIIYEIKDGNIFTKENLLAIQQSEERMVNNTKYKEKLCQLHLKHSSYHCKPPLSVLRFFDGTYQGINPKLYDPFFDNITTVLYTAQSQNLSKAILNFHLGKDAVIDKNTAKSEYTRSLIYIGWPIETFLNINDREEDQRNKLDEIIAETFAEDLEKQYENGVKSLKVYYDNSALRMHAIQNQVVFDMMLAVASFVFIFLFVWFQTGSLWLTSWGIFSIISSFNITNLIYRVVLDYRYIGVFHVLSIFIILGIGSDDIFIFMDTWKQSNTKSFSNLADRLSLVYKHSTKTTLVTSLTTIAAFISNMQSPLLAVSSFGLFSSVLIAVNYISVIIFYPTVMIFRHKNRIGRCCCGPMCKSRNNRPENNDNTNNENLSKKKNFHHYIINFLQNWFFRNIVTHKISRWLVIVFFLILTTIMIRFAVLLEPDKEQVKVWKPDTNWRQARDLSENAFRASQEDRVVIVHIIWGLKEQDRSSCHHTDYKCKGKTVFDKSFDLNSPPCQNAMLDLCNKLKNIPAGKEKDLKLRRNQVTGEIEIKCIFQRMNEYLKDESNKSKYPASSDFTFPINKEKMSVLIEHNPTIFNVALPKTYYRYFEVAVGFFITQGQTKDYKNSFDYKKYKNLIGGEVYPSMLTNKTISQGNKYGQRLLYVAISANTTVSPRALGFKEGLKVHDEWEEFTNNAMKDFPPSCSNGFQATVSYFNIWHWLKVQKILVHNATTGIMIGLILTLIVLTLTTANVIVGLMATITIAMVTAGVLGVISIVGWKLGLFESLNLTLIVGLAVDYVVHLAEGYMVLEDQDRLTRVRYTLGHVGISVFSGACTTLGASIFMLAAKIIFFAQFGIFIFCTIGFSILYSLFFFTTILALIGPEGQTGSLRPLMKKLKNFIRGKTKDHEDCATCKGKGFYKNFNIGMVNTAHQD